MAQIKAVYVKYSLDLSVEICHCRILRNWAIRKKNMEMRKKHNDDGWCSGARQSQLLCFLTLSFIQMTTHLIDLQEGDYVVH